MRVSFCRSWPPFDGLTHRAWRAARAPFGRQQAGGKSLQGQGDEGTLLVGLEDFCSHAQEQPERLESGQRATEAHAQGGHPDLLGGLQARARHQRQGHQERGDLLGGSVRRVAGQRRLAAGAQVHLQLMIGDLLFPAAGVETQQFQSGMRLLVVQARPQAHLAPGSTRAAHATAHLAHEERAASREFGLLSSQAHFHERAAVVQACEEFGPGRLADPQQERLVASGGRARPEPGHEGTVAVESVAQEQALRGQAGEQLAGQGRFALHQIRGRDGGGQGRVGAQLHEHRATQFGEGRLEAPGGRLGHRAEDARGVGTRELRAVDAHESKPRVERLGLARGISQRDQRLGEDGLEDFPGHGQAALAGRRIADLLAGEFLEVSRQRAPRLADVVDQAPEQFGGREPGWAPQAGTVQGHDLLELPDGQQPLEVSEKGVCIAQTGPSSSADKPLNFSGKNELLHGIGIKGSSSSSSGTLFFSY